MATETRIYTAFGLVIQSEMVLPALLPHGGAAEVFIQWGNAPEIVNPVVQTPWYAATRNEFWLQVDGIAKYYVHNGRQIIIEPYSQSQEQDIRVFLLNRVITALLQQREYLVLHGSAAVVDGTAVLLAGRSGVGKTALALSLYERGYPILADEICAVKIEQGQAVLYPAMPQLHVWQDTLRKMNKPVENYTTIRTGVNQYEIPLGDGFCPRPVELTQIIALKNSNQETLRAALLKGGQCFERLMDLSHGLKRMEVVTDKAKHFTMCATLIQTAKLRQVEFNGAVHTIPEVTDFIVKELK